ncbi:MAG TPA: type II toxin-antitoxin system HicB family antitoxin [Polyangia bacterium]|nr:type II toxin-antitoxin system HicB family antitoxin [Polyangia bacterium]
MRYGAITRKEGQRTLVEFPDCPGCQTFAEPGEEVKKVALEALEGWLEANLVAGKAPPRPRARKASLWIVVPAKLAVKLSIRWARLQAGLTQAQLAKLAGLSQPQIAKLEQPDHNPTIDTLERVASALHATLNVELLDKAS